MFNFKKQKNILAIDIGSTALKLAVLEVSGSSVKLLKTKIKEIPVTVKKTKEEVVKEFLPDFLRDSGLPKQVYLAICVPCVEIDRINLPSMPVEEVKEALKWKLKDKITYSIDDAVIDYTIAEEVKKEDGGKELVALTAVANRKEIGQVISVFRSLDFTVEGISAIPFSLANYLRYIKDVSPEESVIFVEFGAYHTYVAVYQSNKLVLERNVPVSSTQITDAMCDTLVTDKGRVQLTREEAEDIKRRFGFPFEGADKLDDKIYASQITGLVRPVLEHLASEIKRTITYYTGELSGPAPKRIYLTGGGARLRNLDTFLKKELDTDVQLLNLPEGIINETSEDNQSLLSFFGVMSVGLSPSGKQLNLLPEEFAGEKKKTIQKISIRMIGFTVLSVLVLLFISANIRIRYYRERLNGAKLHWQALQEIITLYNKISQRDELVTALKRNQTLCDLLLKEISNIVPDNIVLSRLNVNANTKQVVFSGIVYPASQVVEDDLTKFMDIIEKSGFFKDANLSTVEKNQDGGKLTAKFEIVCSVS